MWLIGLVFITIVALIVQFPSAGVGIGIVVGLFGLAAMASHYIYNR